MPGQKWQTAPAPEKIGFFEHFLFGHRSGAHDLEDLFQAFEAGTDNCRSKRKTVARALERAHRLGVDALERANSNAQGVALTLAIAQTLAETHAGLNHR